MQLKCHTGQQLLVAKEQTNKQTNKKKQHQQKTNKTYMY